MNIYIGESVEVSDMQGPCPYGFHVPLITEWQAIYNAFTGLGLSGVTNFLTYLKIPSAGGRSYSNANFSNRGSRGYYWSSNTNGVSDADMLSISSSSVSTSNGPRSYGRSVRGIKNTPVTPTSSWTKLYGTSIESGGIFHNSTDGIISISSDGTTWYTLMDKNLGATTVYNYGDTMTEANCGKVYQRGNNYGFSGDENYDVSKISQSSTQVNVTGYGPGNYYESSTWITTNPRQSSANNGNNLRGGVSQGSGTKSVEVKNIYIGEYKPIYRGEYIEYKMNADALGALYIPVCGFTSSGNQGASYNWKISIDGGAEVTESGTGGTQTSISYTGYTVGSNHTIKITPVSESYGWARAYAWYGLSKRTLLTEIVYDASYMGYAVSATDTGGYFRTCKYYGCTSITKPAEEYMPDTVTTIGTEFREYEYTNCSSLTYASSEELPSSVTTIGTAFRMGQYSGCTALTEIKGWKDLSIGNAQQYRASQFSSCNTNKTVKVLSDVGYSALDSSVLNNSYVTSVYVPNAYLTNFKNTSNYPWVGITDSKFIGY